jgi:hypothetical protein
VVEYGVNKTGGRMDKNHKVKYILIVAVLFRRMGASYDQE